MSRFRSCSFAVLGLIGCVEVVSADDDTAAVEPPPCCDAEPLAVVAPCPAGNADFPVPTLGQFTRWESPDTEFRTDDGRIGQIAMMEDGDAFSLLPDLAAAGPLWVVTRGQCEGNKDGTLIAAATDREMDVLVLVVTNREHDTIGPLVIDAPRDTTTCPGLDRGGCWEVESPKPVRITDGAAEHVAWQGPAETLGRWSVTVMAAFSGAGEVRCPNCCNSERFAMWLAPASQ